MVYNVEEGVRFMHNLYGVCKVIRFVETGQGRIASDIWLCEIESTGERITLTDWAICDCREVH